MVASASGTAEMERDAACCLHLLPCLAFVLIPFSVFVAFCGALWAQVDMHFPWPRGSGGGGYGYGYGYGVTGVNGNA